MNDLTTFFASEPYSWDKAEKSARLTAKLKELTGWHRTHCAPYRRILDRLGVDIDSVGRYEDLPFLPVPLFKSLELRSVADESVFKTLTSSGTTGQAVSRIFLDRETAASQQKTLVKIVSSFTGAARLPMLIILAENETGSALVYVGMLFVLYREGLPGVFLLLIGLAIVLFILTLKTSVWVSLAVLGVIGLLYLWYTLRQTRPLSRERRFSLRMLLLGVVVFAGLVFSTDFAFNKVLQDHQRLRIEVLLGMKDDPHGVGYNVRQSMIAIGSGGFFGKGFTHGTQNTGGFVPEQSTDFIFCTVGEEWGFFGCLMVLVLYGILIARIIRDAERAREAFTRIYGYCVAACLFMHLFINVGMTIGLMPVIGIPLPFLSYGGSSLWGFTVMLFIFIALNRQEKKYF